MESDLNKLSESLINPSIDLAEDYAEMGIDSFINDEMLKEVPVVKTLVAVVKTGIAFKHRLFVKNFLVFLKELHSSGFNTSKIEDFKNKFKSDSSYRKKVTEELLVIIESLNSVNKSKILGHLFLAYVDGVYTWERFIVLSHTLEKLEEVSYPFLKAVTECQPPTHDGKLVTVLKHLFGKDWETGLRGDWIEAEAFLTSAGVANRNGTLFSITPLGRQLLDCGISQVKI